MRFLSIPIAIMLFVYAGLFSLFLYLIILLIKALRKYLKSEPVRNEKKHMAKHWVKSYAENDWTVI